MSYDTKNIFGIKKVNKLFRNDEIIFEDDMSRKYENIVANHDLILIYRPIFFQNEKIVPTKLEDLFSKLDIENNYLGLFTRGCSFELFDELIENYNPGWHLISEGIVEGTEKLNYTEQSVILHNTLQKIRRDTQIQLSLDDNRVFNNKVKSIGKLNIAKDVLAPSLKKLKCNNYRHSFMDYIVDSIIINLTSDNIYNKEYYIWTKDNISSRKDDLDDFAMVGFQDRFRMLAYTKPEAFFNGESDLATTFSIPIR